MARIRAGRRIARSLAAAACVVVAACGSRTTLDPDPYGAPATSDAEPDAAIPADVAPPVDAVPDDVRPDDASGFDATVNDAGASRDGAPDDDAFVDDAPDDVDDLDVTGAMCTSGACSDGVNVGGPNDDGIDVDAIVVWEFVPSCTIDVVSIDLRHDDVNRIASVVYDDDHGAPGTQLTPYTPAYYTGGRGWRRGLLSAPLRLVAGRRYWIGQSQGQGSVALRGTAPTYYGRQPDDPAWNGPHTVEGIVWSARVNGTCVGSR